MTYPQHYGPYGAQAPAPRNGMGLAGLIVGLAGALLGLVPLTGWLAVICALVALPLALVGLSRTRRGEANNQKTAISGVIAGVLALALGIWGMTIFFTTLNKLSSDLEDLGGSNVTIPQSTPSAQVVPYTYSAPQTATPPAQPQNFEGTGDDVLTVDVSELAVLTFECPKCSGNTVVKTNANLLVNTIGSYPKGKHLLNGRSWDETTKQIQVNARGAWKLSITEGLSDATVVTNGEPVSGKGDAVVVLKAATSAATVSYKGEGNFAVWTFPATGSPDLAVNEIGSYNGKVIMNGPAVVALECDGGDWTLAPA